MRPLKLTVEAFGPFAGKEIIDFTQIFKKYDLNKIYLPGKYGGHLSNFGNLIVAKTLKKLN